MFIWEVSFLLECNKNRSSVIINIYFYIFFNLIVSVFGLNEFSIQGYIMPNVHGNIIGEIVLILLIFGLSIGIIQRKIKNYEVI